MLMVAQLHTFTLVYLCLMQDLTNARMPLIATSCLLTQIIALDVQDLQMLLYGQSYCMQVLIGSKGCISAECCLLCGAMWCYALQ